MATLIIDQKAIKNQSTITYQVESWAEYYPEVLPLWVLHWKEVALSHAQIPLDPDIERYQAFADAGQLHILSMRDQGKLVGYHVTICVGHLHYKGTLHGLVDLYYVLPASRKGRAGIRLFQEAERALRARGVVKLQTATKIHAHLDMSRLLEHLGYTQVEKVYAKLLGGA